MFVSSHHITRSASCYLYLYTYTSRTSAISLITLYSNNSVCSSGHAGCAQWASDFRSTRTPAFTLTAIQCAQHRSCERACVPSVREVCGRDMPSGGIGGLMVCWRPRLSAWALTPRLMHQIVGDVPAQVGRRCLGPWSATRDPAPPAAIAADAIAADAVAAVTIVRVVGVEGDDPWRERDRRREERRRESGQ